MYVIEGTWEEVKRHEAELRGRRVRLTVKPEKPAPRTLSGPTQKAAPAHPRRVSAMGKYAGVLSSEDFVREKQEEIGREDRAR